MMPLSLPRYTCLSEFMGAGRAGRLGETAAPSFQGKKSQKSSRGLREAEGEREHGLSEKEEEEKNPWKPGQPQLNKESGLVDFISPLRLDRRRCVEAFRGAWCRGWWHLHSGVLEQTVAGLLQLST